MEILKNLTREIATIGQKSLVEVYNKGDFGKEETVKYVVCYNYNPGKAYGTQWDWGHYYDIWNDEKEVVLKIAMMDLLSLPKMEIEYNRLVEIASNAIQGHFDTDEETAREFCNDVLELTDEERTVLGVKPNHKYDVVEVIFTRSFECRKTFVIPHGMSGNDIDHYIDADYDIDDSEFEDSECGMSTSFEIADHILSDVSYERAREEDTYNDIDDIDEDDFE